MNRTRAAFAAAATAALLLAATPAPGTDKVTGNTVDESAGENGSEGWWFDRDASTSTPYEFTTDEASTGFGSLYVRPIGADALDKFIAENFLFMSAGDWNSLSYDFRIAGNGDASDANEFYLNVYTNLPGQAVDNFYDCRFNYVPSTGSTSDWTTATFAAGDTPTSVSPRGGAICPATMGALPPGSTIRVFAINVGDTSASDAGLAGYLDNVVLDHPGGATTWDFEATPQSKDDCKKGGWEAYGFKNQGQCVSSVVASPKAGKK